MSDQWDVTVTYRVRVGPEPRNWKGETQSGLDGMSSLAWQARQAYCHSGGAELLSLQVVKVEPADEAQEATG